MSILCKEKEYLLALLGAVFFSAPALGANGQCNAPSWVPAGVTCYCDDFTGSNLTSKIFNQVWTVSSSGDTTYYPQFTSSGHLSLTTADTHEATSATLGAYFPAAGNYISIEFRHYSYQIRGWLPNNGSGADGLGFILSDYTVSPNPGAFGGSLGYAQKSSAQGADTTHDGFAGGWLGMAVDEWGNYILGAEGREDGVVCNKNGAICSVSYTNCSYSNCKTAASVAVRGSYNPNNTPPDYSQGYPLLQYSLQNANNLENTNAYSPQLGYYYRVIVDARNYLASNHVTNVQVDRAATCKGGAVTDFCPVASDYSSIVTPFNAFEPTIYPFPKSSQADLPDNWQISFTGSTGASVNNHEISGLRVCAAQIFPSNGTAASGFNAIDQYLSGTDINVQSAGAHIYTQVVGLPFYLNIAALNSAGNGVFTGYSPTGNKKVTVELIDNSSATVQAQLCANKPAGFYSQQMTFAASDKGFKLTPNQITVTKPYSNVIVRMSDGVTTGCSTDNFSIKPPQLVVTSSDLDGTNGSSINNATKLVKAGNDFGLNATAMYGASILTDYGGQPTLDNSKIQDGVSSAMPSSFLSCTFDPAMNGNLSTGVSVGKCSYGDVGYFSLKADAVIDSSFTQVDQVRGDCVAGSTSNTKSAGKVGCNVGSPQSTTWGRFIPDHFDISGLTLSNRAEMSCSNANADGFSYIGEPVQLAFTINALNKGGVATKNYDANKVDASGVSWARLNGANVINWTSSSSGVVPSNLNLWGVNLANSDPNNLVLTTKTFTKTEGFPSIQVYGAAVGGCGAPSGKFAAGSGNFSACAQLARGTSPEGPYENFFFGVAPTDADGVTVSSSALNLDADGDKGKVNERVAFPATKERFGVLRLLSAYGSELLGLNLPMQALYYTGTGFQLNGQDNCTTVGTANVAATPPGVSALSSSLSKLQLSGGQGYLAFTAPSSGGTPVSGSVDVALDLGNVGDSFNTCVTSLQGSTTVTPASMPWLRGFWGPAASCRSAAAYNQDPNARLRFGSSKAPFIYMRERY